jgi:branched-chain amino acid transport system substrate-binding protein
VNSNKIPLVVLWDSSNELQNLGDWVMAMGFSLEAAGEDIASHAYTDLGFRKIAIEAAQDEWSDVVSASFAEKFTALGGQIVLHEKTPISQPDFKTNIVKAKQAGAESIYFPHYPQGNVLIARQARELGFTGTLLSGDVFDESAIQSLGKYANNIHIAQMWLTDEAFKAKYAARYGEAPNSINLAFAAIGYDGIRLAAETYKGLEAKGVKNPSSEQIRDYIKTLKFDGVTGRTEFDSHGRSHKREHILKVENGAFQLVKQNDSHVNYYQNKDW